MKIKFLILALVLFGLTAEAKINVVATIPDFGSIAQEIGGDKVKVTTICKGTEDPHFVDARPSLVRVLNQADVLIETGAELEVGWLPPLVNGARNNKILSDAPGHVILSRGLQLLEIPTGQVDRSMGDVHPGGNPHFWLDPANGKAMAKAIAEAFAQVDAANAAFYKKNLENFSTRLTEKIAAWTKLLEAYRGTKVATYHKSYNYLLERFGLKLVATVEPKPGIEPSPGYINSLIPQLKEQEVKLIIIEPFRPRKTPQYVAEAVGGKLLVLADKVGADDKAKDYISLFDSVVSEIANVLASSK